MLDPRLEPLRARMHEMVECLFDDAANVFAEAGQYPTLRLTVENEAGVRVDLVVAILPEGQAVPDMTMHDTSELH